MPESTTTTTIFVADNRRGSLNAGAGSDDWDDLLSTTEADSSTLGETNIFAIRAGALEGRGGTTYRLSRWFIFFDVSSITDSGVINSANLIVAGAGISGDYAGIALTSATAWGGEGEDNIALTDIDNVGGTSFSSNKFGSPNYSSWVTGSQSSNTFVLNSTAIEAMNENGYLNASLRNFYYDIDEADTPEADNYVGIRQWLSTNSFNAAYRPRLVITHTPTAQDWGGKMNGVISATGNKYFGRNIADIKKINSSTGGGEGGDGEGGGG